MITILPAIDLINGEAVRLVEGDFSQKTVYFKDPIDAAKQIQDAGLQHLHLVDLDNAKTGKLLSLKVLESIASKTELVIDYGGGIKKLQDVQDVLNAGARQVNCGSIAVKDQELFSEWLKDYSEQLILSADVKDNKIASSGWQEDSGIEIENFINAFLVDGLTYITSTDVSKDGRLEGPSFELYRKLKGSFPEVNLCASGGISTLENIKKLDAMGIDRVIVGKAIYEGRISLKQLKDIENA